MNKLYVSENGVTREYTDVEYAQVAIDKQNYEQNELPKTIRNSRNIRLAACDWTQTLDSPLSAEQKTAWATYRQALRDVTTQSGFPSSITWPTAPQ
jgi:hypothetical protein